jgi:hypothetical protein
MASAVPVMCNLRCPALQPRHWASINEQMGFAVRSPEQLAEKLATQGRSQHLHPTAIGHGQGGSSSSSSGGAGLEGVWEGEEEDDFSMGELLSRGAVSHAEALRDTAARASAEQQLVEMLNKARHA